MSAVPPNLQPQNPYLGLRPFEENEKDRFFGRDEEIHILTDKILANRLTLLVAASGVGKSSLLQAGVMPALRAGGMADLIYYKDWALDPLAGLKQAVADHLIERRRIGEDYRPDPNQSLDRFLRIHSLLAEGMLVILLDQFEEFFYYHRFSKQRDLFVEQLAAAIRDADTSAAFVFSMREDFAMELNAFKPHLRSVFDTVYRIEKLKPGAARLAIEEPARNLGFTYQAELIERLLDDLGSRERENRPSYENFDAPLLIEPPHLQIVCRELWQRAAHSEDRCIGLPHYESLGGAKGVLEGYFLEQMKSLSGEQQRLASRAFDHLVSQHGAKMTYPLQELADLISENPEALGKTLEHLQDVKILRRVKRQGQPWYELYHDIFAKSINAWSRDYKGRQQRKELLWGGVRVLLGCAIVWLSMDGYENRYDRHLRLGKQTVSERVEMYQGKLDSTDIFNQQKFLFETDFEWLDLEADERFKKTVLRDLRHDQEFQIKLLPLEKRFIAYARNGLYQKAFEVADDMRTSKDDQLLGKLVKQLAFVKANSVIYQFDLICKANQDNAELLISTIHSLLALKAESVVKLLIKELLNADSNVKAAAINALVQLKAKSAVPPLIERLMDNDSYVRRRAYEALVQLNAKSAVPQLIEKMKDGDAGTRLVAINALDQLKAESAIPPLIERLKDDGDVQWAAMMALVHLKAEPAIPPLIELLNDDDASTQQGAIYALAQLKAEAAILPLIERLKDGNADVRKSAIEALGQLKAESAIPPLIEWLKDTHADVRKTAIDALGQLKAETAILPLIERLKDGDAGVRRAAIEALVQLKAKSAIPRLIDRLKDDNDNVRWAVIEALVQLKADSSIPLLTERLRDSNAGVRRKVIDALVQLKAESAVPRLIECMGDKDADVRKNAIEALIQFKAESAVPHLIERLRDSNAGVRRKVIDALVQLKAESAVARLIECMGDKDADVRKNAIEALVQLKAESAISPLIEWLKDKDADVRKTAIEALVQLKAGTAIASLIERLKDDNADVQRAAIEAMSELKATSAVPNLIELMKVDDAVVRVTVIGALIQLMKGEPAVRLLIEHINDKNESVRQMAILGLGMSQLKAKSAVPLLIERLKDGNVNVRVAAIEALDQLDPESAIEPLIERLKDDNNAYVQQTATNALVQLKAESAIPLLIERLKDKDAKVQWQAIGALVQLKADSVTLPLIERVKDEDDNAYLSEGAIEALGQLEASSAVLTLIERLKNGTVDVRLAVTKALSQLKAESAIPLLIEQLEDTYSTIRMIAIESLGVLSAKQAAPALLELLTENEDAKIKQNAARALSRMHIDAPELASWQEQQLTQLAEKLTTASPEEKANIAGDLGFVYHAQSIDLLKGLLADEDEKVVSKVLASLGGIGAYHPEWLKPHVDRLFELSKQPNSELQEAAIAAIGQIISFAGGAPESALGDDESRLREGLAAIAKDSTQKRFLRVAAIDALGACGRPTCAEALLAALQQDDRQIDLRFSLTHWLARLRYAQALPALQRQLDALVKDNQVWRANRDKDTEQADSEDDAASNSSGDNPMQPETNPAKKAPKNWQQEAQVFQVAYAIASIDPDKEGIALLNHPLHAAREAAIYALAGRADGALIKKLLETHQAFDPDDLPSPLPYALFRALDMALHTVEYTGTADDLKILQAIKGKRIETPMKTQEDAINERLDWTLAELEHRLNAIPAKSPT